MQLQITSIDLNIQLEDGVNDLHDYGVNHIDHEEESKSGKSQPENSSQPKSQEHQCETNNQKFQLKKTKDTRTVFCLVCGQVFQGGRDISIHMKTHKEQGLYDCGLCEKSFDNNKALEAHRAIHKEEEVFECKMCGERFMKLKEYEKHCLNEGELEMCTMLRQVCRSPIAQETCVFQFS